MATVAHTFELPDGTPDQGRVSFRLPVAAVDDTPDVHTVTTRSVVAELDATGSFTVDLTASDDPGWRLDAATVAAGGMPYIVTIRCTTLHDVFTAYIPEGVHDLADLITLAAPPDVATVPGPPGPAGPAGPPGPAGAGAQWESVTLWADLPVSGNYPGRKMRVTSGLGVCLAVWNGTGWVVAPESDTGWSAPVALINSWTGSLIFRRVGMLVYTKFYNLTGALNHPYVLKTGYRQNPTADAIGVSANKFDGTSGALYLEPPGLFYPFGGAKGNAGTWTEASWLAEPTWPTTAP